MCECLKKMGDDLQARLTADMPEGSEVTNNLFDGVGWQGQMLNFSKGNIEVMLRYRVGYRIKKKNGDMAKNLTRRECSVRMSYCPICGEKQDG